MRQTPENIDWNSLRELRDLFLADIPLDRPYWTSLGQLHDYDRTLGERIGWKWDAVIRELKCRNWTPPSRTLTDFGCGTGIAARRILAAFPDAFDSVTLVDHSAIAAGFARDRIQELAPGLPVTFDPPSAALHGTVLISHVLTELPEEDRAALTERLQTADAVVWVEPGTERCGKSLVRQRERLRESFTLVAPCPHQQACGLLLPENEAHWCHHFAPAPSSAHQDPFWGHFRRELNLDIAPVAYSFLVTDKTAKGDEGLNHLIGRPLRAPKFLRVLSCQKEDIAELVASRRSGDIYRPLKQNASPAVYQFERRKNRITGGAWLGEKPN
jgi:SAM-dependent methyltransferase